MKTTGRALVPVPVLVPAPALAPAGFRDFY
jgi:hypothetical protein